MLGRVVSTLFLLLIISSPAWARVMNLETAAPVPDRSDASVSRALQGALDGCVRQATAMGLPWIRLEDAVLAGDRVVVQVIATDEADEAQRRNMVPVWEL
jgi:hypothetical protein